MTTNYGTRPLKENWPKVRVGEAVEDCRKCGEETIVRPELEQRAREIYPDIEFLCTRCVVEIGTTKV